MEFFVGVTAIFLPRECSAVERISSASDPHFVPVINGWGAGVSHLEEDGEHQFFLRQLDLLRRFPFVFIAKLEKGAGGIMAGDQIHQRIKGLWWVILTGHF